MNEKVLEALTDLLENYKFGEKESRAMKLALSYTEKGINDLIHLIKTELMGHTPKSIGRWTIPRCEVFCHNLNLSMPVQQVLEELCLWIMYGIDEYLETTLVCCDELLAEIRKNPTMKISN